MTGRFEHNIRLSDSARSQNSETKSDKSIIQHIYSTKYDCTTLEEFLGIDNMNIPDFTEDFKITIDTFVPVSKSRSENEASLEFDNHLKKFNAQITFTGNQKGGEFEQVFRRKQPDFTWSIAAQFYAWNIVTIIEKKKISLTRNEISQMLEYLRMIVQISPERIYAVGCLTNYNRIIFGKASIINNQFYYEIYSSANVVEEYWKFLHCNPIHLGHVKFSLPGTFEMKLCLGRGANGVVYQIEYQNTQYAMKISNQKSMKEYEIAENMKIYINEHQLHVQIMNMFIVEGFILSKPVGKIMKKDQLCQKRYISQILIQLAIGHQLGLVHRDIRMYNLVLFNNEYAYLIDWDSSTYNGFNGVYEGAFLTASTPVLMEYESSRGRNVSAYYADDCISVIYMVLLLSCCTKEEETELKCCASDSDAGCLIVQRRGVLRKCPKEVIDRLADIERERVTLTNIDDLHNRCQQIIETIYQLGLLS